MAFYQGFAFLLAVLCVVAGLVNAKPVEDASKTPFGSPFFDEIVVESTLTVRGKSGAARQSRGKQLQIVPSTTSTTTSTTSTSKPDEASTIKPDVASTSKPDEASTSKPDVASTSKPDEASTSKPTSAEEQTTRLTDALNPESNQESAGLTRPKRQHRGPPRRHHGGQFANPNFRNSNNGRPGFNGQGFPSGGASSANAASQGFNVAGPNGFGASASNAASQGFQFGPNGITGGASQAASQTYRLPNGNSLNVAFSNGFNVGGNGASQSAANSITLTGANGQQQQLFRG